MEAPPPIVIPTSPRVSKNEDVIKVSFRQGAIIFTCLAISLLLLTSAVVYYGFWMNLYDKGENMTEFHET